MDEIKIVNLIAGPPIIAKVSIEDDYYVLEDPFNVVWSEAKGDDEQPRFTVFDVLALSSDTEIEVAKKHVLFSHTPLPEIVEQYNAMMLNKLTPITGDD
jgi:hypothetical protein